MVTTNFTWRIGGEAGMGIKVTGMLISKLFTRAGFYLVADSEYPSLIRGGHNNFTLRVHEEEIFCYDPQIDILMALNKDTLEKNRGLMNSGGIVVYDSEAGKIHISDFTSSYKGCQFIDVPLGQIVKSINGDQVLRNVVSLGATLALLNMDLGLLKSLLTEIFAKKGEEIVSLNMTAAEKGYDFIKKAGVSSGFHGTPTRRDKRMAITGNEALAMGALRGGLKLYCAYPMTPSTSILHFLAEHESEFNMVVKQTEDEIAAINMAIGGAHMGARSMVATSGGGFSLMVEGLGLAAITETPIVIVLGQRPGPATGLPTWTGQADLRFALHAAQDEFLRVLLAPGDPEEAFFAAAHALQLAERYHIPVIILTDKYLAETVRAMPLFEESNIKVTRDSFADEEYLSEQAKKGGYRRYAVTKTGVTLRSVPGQINGMFLANSDEHDTYGFSEESELTRTEQMDKRWRKEQFIREELPEPAMYGDQGAELTFISWGSTKGAILQAQKDLSAQGVKSRFFHNVYLYPFPTKFYQGMRMNPAKTIFVETNIQGQFAGLFREHTGNDIKHSILKNNGRPIYTSDITTYVTKNF